MQYPLGNEVSFLRATAGQAPHAVIALRVEEQARRSTNRNAVTPSPFAHADVCSIKPLNEYRAPTKMDLALLEGKTHNIRIRLLCGQCHHLKKMESGSNGSHNWVAWCHLKTLPPEDVCA
jgi:hypothetical protein